MSWPQIKNIIVLKSHLLLICSVTTNHFSIGFWCVMKSGFYTISLVVGPRRSSKALPKAKLAPRKGHGHCLVVCCQSDPLQLSKSQWNHYIWEVCSANQWDASKTVMPAAAIGQQKRPHSSLRQCLTAHHTTNTSKVEQIGHNVCFIHHLHLTSHQPTTTSCKHLNNFLQGKRFHNQQEAENAFQDYTESWNKPTTGINQLISHWQKCVGCNGSYFD